MIYLGESKFDAGNADLVAFVQSGAKGDQWLPSAPAVQVGYHPSTNPPIILGRLDTAGIPLMVPWTVTQVWAVREITPNGPQNITNVNIVTSAWKEVVLSAQIQLYIRDGVQVNVENKIDSAFLGYQYPASGDVDAYIKAALDANPEVGPYDFGLTKGYVATIASDLIIDNAKLDALRARINERYDLSLISETFSPTLQPPPPNPNEIESNNPDQAAEDAANERMKDTKCESPITKTKRIGRQGFVPQSRWEWGWHSVKIGCVIFDLYYPTFQHRDQDLIEYLSVTYPPTLGSKGPGQVESCARDAILAGVVAAIVFTDLTTALALFKALFWKCILDKFSAAVECVDAEIFIVLEPNGDWH